MNKLLFKFIFLISFVVLIFPNLSLADGMLVSPPNYWIRESDQKAVIFYNKGIETLVLSIKFSGNAKNFGWIVPVPNKPTVEKGSQKLFTELEKLTQTTYKANQVPLGTSKLYGGDGTNQAITVVEEKTIDYYDVTVLTSTDKDALTKWFTDNNYKFPSDASYLLDSYIQNKWYFIATKINTESTSQGITQQLNSGTATPLKISFETKNIVFPLKLTSLNQASDILESELNQYGEITGTAGEWAGCRGTGVHVCVEAVKEVVGSDEKVDEYFNSHPDCIKNFTCQGTFFTCNKRCSRPTNINKTIINTNSSTNLNSNVDLDFDLVLNTNSSTNLNSNVNSNSDEWFNTNSSVKGISTVNNNVGILIYVFANHKKDITGFTTQYANWIKKKDIEKLATTDQGDPWLKPKSGKYYLTKLSGQLNTSQMTEDIFPQNAENNNKVGGKTSSGNPTNYDIIQIILIFSVIFFAVFFTPPGLLFIACAFYQFLGKNKIVRIICWVLQALLLGFYGLILLVVLITIFSSNSVTESWFHSIGLSHSDQGTLITIAVLLGIAIIAIGITMILQIRHQIKKMLSSTSVPKETIPQ